MTKRVPNWHYQLEDYPEYGTMPLAGDFSSARSAAIQAATHAYDIFNLTDVAVTIYGPNSNVTNWRVKVTITLEFEATGTNNQEHDSVDTTDIVPPISFPKPTLPIKPVPANPYQDEPWVDTPWKDNIPPSSKPPRPFGTGPWKCAVCKRERHSLEVCFHSSCPSRVIC